LSVNEEKAGSILMSSKERRRTMKRYLVTLALVLAVGLILFPLEGKAHMGRGMMGGGMMGSQGGYGGWNFCPYCGSYMGLDMMEGRFREDLYYRLNVIPITVPPLRERKDDIALLAKHFLEIYSAANSKPIRGFSEEVMQVFLDYNWPGNVRELQNVVEHAVILAKGEVITQIDLPHNLRETVPHTHADIFSLKDTERNLILRVLREAGGSK